LEKPHARNSPETGDPKGVGKLAWLLCAEDAGYITGRDILIDGGWTAQ